MRLVTDVLFVGRPDSMTPLGTKGVGELAITGMAAAIANAVFHATGARIRSLPISIEKVLGHESASPRTPFRRPRWSPQPRAQGTKESESAARRCLAVDGQDGTPTSRADYERPTRWATSQRPRRLPPPRDGCVRSRLPT